MKDSRTMLIRLGNEGAPRARIIDTQCPAVRIPDLWHIAQAQQDLGAKAAIMECWHLAHDFRNALYDLANEKSKATQPEWLSQALNEGDGTYKP